jgi:hypothetical protein
MQRSRPFTQAESGRLEGLWAFGVDSAYSADENMHPEQKKSLKSMTPSQRLQVAVDLYHAARELKAAGLRHQHPDWAEERIRDKVREIFRNAGD